MSEPQDRLLSNAGGLLMAAGCIAAFTGGLHGLQQTRPGLVVSAILLLMGYGVVGFLLMNRGREYFQYAMPAAAVLVLTTLLLFGQLRDPVDREFAYFILYPTLALVLSYAGGALLTHAVEVATPRVAWPAKGAGSLNTLLHVAAAGPIWSAFVLLSMVVEETSMLRTAVIGGSVLVAVACVLGGNAASRRSHPRFTVLGATLGFLAGVYYLFQFMLGGGDRDLSSFGQLLSLLVLIATGITLAIGAVAWLQVANGMGDGSPDAAA